MMLEVEPELVATKTSLVSGFAAMPMEIYGPVEAKVLTHLPVLSNFSIEWLSLLLTNSLRTTALAGRANKAIVTHREAAAFLKIVSFIEILLLKCRSSRLHRYWPYSPPGSGDLS